MVTTNPNAHKITLVMELTDRNVAAGLLKAKRDVKKFYADVNKDPGVRRGKQDIAPDASNLRASREEIDRINKSLERHKQVQPRRGIGFVNQRGEVIGGGPSPRGMGGRGMVSAVGQPLNMAPFQEDITDMTKALKSNTREMSRATGMLRQPQARMTTAPDPGFQRGPLFPPTPLRRSDGGNPLTNARSESMYANEKLIELQRLRKEAREAKAAAAGGAKKPPARPPAPPGAPAPGERHRGLPFAIEPRHKRGFAMAEQLMSDLGTGQGGDVRSRMAAVHRTAYGAERLRGVNLGDIMAQSGLPAGTSAEDFRRMADEVAGEAGARRSASARAAGRAGAAGRVRRGGGGDIGAMFEDLKKILGPPPPNVRKLSKSLGDKMQALEGYRRTYGEGPDLDALERSLKIGGTRGALFNELKEAGLGQDDANRMIQAQERLFRARSKYESFTDDLDPKRKKALDSQFREYNKLMDRQGEFKGMFERGQITEAERATRTTGLGLGRRRYDLVRSLDQLQDVAGLAPADRVSPVDLINDQYMRHQEQMADKQEAQQRRQTTREARDRTSQRKTLPGLRAELEKGFKGLDELKKMRAAGGIGRQDFAQRARMLNISGITSDYRREFDRQFPDFAGGGREFLKSSVLPELGVDARTRGAKKARPGRGGLKGLLDAVREPYLKDITRLGKTQADPWQDIINKYELTRVRRQASRKEIGRIDELLAQPDLGGFKRADLEAARESRVRAEAVQERRGRAKTTGYEKAVRIKRSTRAYQEQEAVDRLSLDRRMAEKLTRTVSGLAVLTAGLSVVGMGMGLLLMPAIEMTTEWIERTIQARKNIKEFKLDMLEFGHSIGEATDRYDMFNKSMSKEAKLALSGKTPDEIKSISHLTEQQELRRSYYEGRLKRLFDMEGELAANMSFAAFTNIEGSRTPFFEALGVKAPGGLDTMPQPEQQDLLLTAIKDRIDNYLMTNADMLFASEPSPRAIARAAKSGVPGGVAALAKQKGYLERGDEISKTDADSMETDWKRMLEWMDKEISTLEEEGYKNIHGLDVVSQESFKRSTKAGLDLLDELVLELEMVSKGRIRKDADDSEAKRWLKSVDELKVDIANLRKIRAATIRGDKIGARVPRPDLVPLAEPSRIIAPRSSYNVPRFEDEPTPRAKGGVVGMGETTLVGEEGPELVVLPGGSRVIPNGQFNVSTGIDTKGYEREWRTIESVSSRYAGEVDSVVYDYLRNLSDQWSFIWSGINRSNSENWMQAVSMSDSAEAAARKATETVSDIISADEEGMFIIEPVDVPISLDVDDLEEELIIIEESIGKIPAVIQVVPDLDEYEALMEEMGEFQPIIEPKVNITVEEYEKLREEMGEFYPLINPKAIVTITEYEKIREEMGEFHPLINPKAIITIQEYDRLREEMGEFYPVLKPKPLITVEEYDRLSEEMGEFHPVLKLSPTITVEEYDRLREEMGEVEFPVNVQANVTYSYSGGGAHRPTGGSGGSGAGGGGPAGPTGGTSTGTTGSTTGTTTPPATTPHTAVPGFSPYTYSQRQVTPVAAGGMLGAGDYGLVGERGPELLRMPVRSFVQPNHNLINMLSQNMMQPSVEVIGGSGSRDLTVKLQIGTRDLKEVVLEIVNEELRHKSPNARSI